MHHIVLEHVTSWDLSQVKEAVPRAGIHNSQIQAKELKLEGIKETARSVATIVVEPLVLVFFVFANVGERKFKLALVSAACLLVSPLKTTPCAIVCLAAVFPSLVAPVPVWNSVIALSEKIHYTAPLEERVV